MRPDPSVVLVDGPWRHGEVSANGFRFHLAEAGDGPLVLLLHGFPAFWWSFAGQLPALAAAGYRAVAVDLRGYGASDKPPRGYDAFTLSADVAGMVRALGEDSAVVVGHGYGGYLAWCVATLHPGVVRALAVVSAVHPLVLRSALLSGRGRLGAGANIARFQLPWSPERLLVKDDAAFVARLLASWGGAGYPSEETAQRARQAMLIPGVAHSSMEYFRWSVRSLPRPDGRRFYQALRGQVTVPTLQLHGEQDNRVPPEVAERSARRVNGPYRFALVPAVGHFPHEEAPAAVNAALIGWLGQW